MRSRVYETVERPSVRLSVTSIDSSSGGGRVCCWAPRGQEIFDRQQARSSAAVIVPCSRRRARQHMRAVSRWQPSDEAAHRLVAWSVCLCVYVSVCLLVTAISCAKKSKPFEMPSGVWTRVDPRNRVLRDYLGPGPRGRGSFFGASPGPLWSIGNIRCEPKLFGM